MAAAKRDLSGIFDTELKGRQIQQAAVLDKLFQLTHKGMTFVTDTHLPEWTEVSVKMRLPQSGTRKDQFVHCRGVVVQCIRRLAQRGFEVTLVFLDMNTRDQAQLNVIPPYLCPSSISISR